jgi:hypothetical protein
LRGVVLEEALRLRRGIMRLKTAPHHEKYIYVAWIGFRGDVAPKDNEALQMSCALRQLVEAFQTSCDSNALRCAVAKVCDNLSNRGPMYADGGRSPKALKSGHSISSAPQVYLPMVNSVATCAAKSAPI